MTHLFFSLDDLVSDLEAGRLVLTANQRLSQAILAAYRENRLQQQIPVWPRPRVLAWEHWLHDRWQKLCLAADFAGHDKVLLRPYQELLIWERIVAESDIGRTLLRPAVAARLAQAAYRNVLHWQIPLHESLVESEFRHHADACEFSAWRRSFEQHLDAEGLINEAQMAQQVLAALQANLLAPESRIWYVGFDEFTPIQQSISDKAAQESCIQEIRSQATELARIACDDPEQEWRRAACWAWRISTEDPSARIAVVVPDLAEQRLRVERIFQEQFRPDYGLPDQPRTMPEFNCSAGYPLSQAPLVAAALATLKLSFPVIELTHFCSLLGSPFVGRYNRDAGRRAQWLARIREQGQREFTSTCLWRWSREFDADTVPMTTDQPDSAQSDFIRALNDFYRINRESRFEQSRWANTEAAHLPSEWAQVFNAQLQHLGWPGDRTLDSIEYQQLQHWYTLLNDFADLDNYVGKQPLTEAVWQLSRLADTAILQTQSKPGGVQILGVLEASGLQFSHLWLIGMNDCNWPAAPRPNPLLPIATQIRYGMPHADVQRELLYAERQLARFIHSTDHLIASYALDLDQEPGRPASGIVHFPDMTAHKADFTESFGSLQQQIRAQQGKATVETFIDVTGPQLTQDEPVRGGVSIIKNMAECPFKAFATHRLYARKLPEPESGLTAMERGNLLHWALESFWKKIQNHDCLVNLSRELRSREIQEASHYAITRLQKNRNDLFGKRLLNIEQQRIVRVLEQWLDLEQQREPFAVLATERKVSLDIGGLQLTFRVDRMDRVGNGGLLLLDYKTGKIASSVWFGDRPTEPQLPLYVLAVGNEEPVVAVGFAELRIGECKLNGIGDGTATISGITPAEKMKANVDSLNWQKLQSQWQQVIADLAQRFVAGEAQVDPKSSEVCGLCSLHGLCRIGDRSAAQ